MRRSPSNGALSSAAQVPRNVSVAAGVYPISPSPSSVSPSTSSWDLTEVEVSAAYVPVKQAMTCGVVHTFPVSILVDDEHEHDAPSVAACLATPTLPLSEEAEEEQEEIVVLAVGGRRRQQLDGDGGCDFSRR